MFTVSSNYIGYKILQFGHSTATLAQSVQQRAMGSTARSKRFFSLLPLIQRVYGGAFPRGKAVECEADRSPPPSVEG